MSASRGLATVGTLVAASLVLYAAEGLFPSPLPFLKLGLSNIVTLFALATMGVRAAVAVTALRVLVASALAGTIAGPAFALSMGGGLAAALGMGAAARWGTPPLSVVGVSMVGAACHNLAQLSIVAWLFAGAVSRLVPAALLISAVTGLATGLAARFALDKLGRHVGTWRSAFA
ncbi:MAG: Gx transporter family protein [Candidatus Eisenbacteria bacterium]|nr:Gx transporter family protein [Candidatus Eisenbacteria bacterium]